MLLTDTALSGCLRIGIPLQPSDVYSFAIMAWEVLTGERPFDDLLRAGVPARALLRRIEDGARPDPLRIPADFPACVSVRDILTRGWAPKQASRPAMRDIASVIQAALSSA